MSTRKKLQLYLQERTELEEKQPDDYSFIKEFTFNRDNVMTLFLLLGSKDKNGELLGEIAYERKIHKTIIETLTSTDSLEKNPELLSASLWALSVIAYARDINIPYTLLNRIGFWFTEVEDFDVLEACLWLLTNAMNPYTATWAQEYGITEILLKSFKTLPNRMCGVCYTVITNVHNIIPISCFNQWSADFLHHCVNDRLILVELESLYADLVSMLGRSSKTKQLQVNNVSEVLNDACIILSYLLKLKSINACLLLIGNIITFRDDNQDINKILYSGLVYILQNSAKKSIFTQRLVFWIVNNLMADKIRIKNKNLLRELKQIADRHTTNFLLHNECQIYLKQLSLENYNLT